MRRRTWLVVLVSTVVSLSCSTDDDGAADDAEPANDQPAAINLDTLDPALDEVVMMEPGGSNSPTRFDGRESDVTLTRQILEATGPLGTSSAFEVVARVDDRQQRCLVVESEAAGGFMDCGPAAAPLERGPDILTGSSGGSPRNPPALQHSIVVLVGPVDTTHFVVESAGRRMGLVAVDGIAVLTRKDAHCVANPTLIEAWDHDELLLEETPPTRPCQ